jgi:uncharacterized protein involved in exopolysaccharide biosynthesis
LGEMTAENAQTVSTPGPGSSVKAVVEALFRHRTLFLATVGLVLAATVLVTLLTPRTYESEMNFLVRNARPDYLISPERSTGQILQQNVTEERINSEIDVLRSKDVADVVVDADWNTKPLAERTESQIRDHEKAVLEFSKHLTVEPLRKSNVIRVAYVAGSPRVATDTVEHLLAAFMAKQHEIEHSSGATSFFASEAARYKQELDAAQASLAGYQQSNQLVSLPDKENTLEGQINGLEDSIRSTQAQVTEAGQRVVSSKSQLSQLPARLSTQQRSVPNTQAVEQLTAILTNYQNKRTELLTRYLPSDRLITEVDQQIATTSAALATARTTNGQESTTDLNPVYQQVRAGLASSTTDLAALRGRLADLTAQRERLKQQLAQVEGSTVDYSTLQSRVAELQSNYQLYSQKKNEAQIAEAMDQQQLVNVAVAERPTFSAKPYRPVVLVNLAMGLLTALLLAASAVFFAELGRDTIASPQELEAVSTVPVLATIPVMSEQFASFSAMPRGGGSNGPGSLRPTPGGSPERPSGGLGPPAEVVPGLRPAMDATPSESALAGLERTEAIETLTAPAAVEEEVQMLTILRDFTRVHEPVRRLERAAVQSFEQIVAGQTVGNPASPVSPFGPRRDGTGRSEAAALPTVEAATPPVAAAPVAAAPLVAGPIVKQIVLEPLDPSHRQTNASVLVRSRLTPSQRAQLHRPAPARERGTYVTYTVDPRS